VGLSSAAKLIKPVYVLLFVDLVDRVGEKNED
jgi:hypothetical protein